MALHIQRPNGTEDITPQNSEKWRFVEEQCRIAAETFGFREIRIPTFESTELFRRSVGETTDVVQKEMYTVSAHDSSFTLRPEGTAGTIRAMLQNGMLNDALPQKVFYILSCFRHERTQAGRLREFHQFGVECAGSSSYYADAEIISLAYSVLRDFGLKNIELFINSIGCPTCRQAYYAALREYFNRYCDTLCETCLSRLEKNPMRILDCKCEECAKIAVDAPVITDYLCDDCASHFAGLKRCLENLGINYSVNPRIVRGLDYYTKTVFEFVTSDIGAQSTICGGGRYDGLISELGGPSTPALGFAIGLERLIMTMNNQGCDFPNDRFTDVYICPMNDDAYITAAGLAAELRLNGFSAEYDLMNRGLKAQMKYANKLGARFVLVLGENEIKSGKAVIKHMSDGKTADVSLENFYADFDAAYVELHITPEIEASMSNGTNLF